ncbi:MAG: DUF413 domain-containing protein [Pseudomonadota bacterium]|nr:DUF413 domain-containing protein [Pseudomonadota bacterium]
MTQVQVKSFDSPKKFFDDANFPRGFHRSGDFTRQQADIIETMGVALKALHEGQRLPETDEEQRFVEFCLNGLDPINAVERAWNCYLKALARKQIYFTASSAASDADTESADSDD